jgi:hypothetical protein
MRHCLSLLVIVGLAVASLLSIRPALAVNIAPPGSGFSAWFPVEPEEGSAPTPEAATFLWVASDGAFIFVIGHTDNAKIIESKAELEASFKNFLTEVNGRVLSRKMTTVSRPDGRPLPAIKFTFAGAKLSGSAIIITEGGRGAYTVMGAKLNDQNGDIAEIDRFMKSFKLTAER